MPENGGKVIMDEFENPERGIHSAYGKRAVFGTSE
jgi:hypothetical protein